MKWVILNANRYRWGDETYPTREAAEHALRAFWKGVSGVNLRKFTIEETDDPETVCGSDRALRPLAEINGFAPWSKRADIKGVGARAEPDSGERSIVAPADAQRKNHD